MYLYIYINRYRYTNSTNLVSCTNIGSYGTYHPLNPCPQLNKILSYELVKPNSLMSLITKNHNSHTSRIDNIKKLSKRKLQVAGHKEWYIIMAFEYSMTTIRCNRTYQASSSMALNRDHCIAIKVMDYIYLIFLRKWEKKIERCRQFWWFVAIGKVNNSMAMM